MSSDFVEVEIVVKLSIVMPNVENARHAISEELAKAVRDVFTSGIAVSPNIAVTLTSKCLA